LHDSIYRSFYKRWKKGEITHAQPDRMALLEAAGFDKLYPELQDLPPKEDTKNKTRLANQATEAGLTNDSVLI
jgi:hypothetical protein